MSNKKIVGSDLQGYTRLVTDATLGVTDLVEAMHKRIVHPPFLPSTPIQHLITNISGIIYKSIRLSTSLIGSGIDKALGQFSSGLRKIESTEEKEALRALVNGVIGDYLKESENPLEIIMQFRNQSSAIPLESISLEKAYPNITGKILVLAHGSCMNDIQWTRKGHNHGSALAADMNKTPIYLNYNSGLHISTNGQQFNNQLEELVQNWPVPVEELVIIAHSMGGLVSRSAFYYGQQQQRSWTKHLKKIIFLGTPHHGASLEKAGNYLDVILEAIPYSKPFARLGKIRSAGVTDLRYGNLIDEDWQDFDRFKLKGDQRQRIPLPKQGEFYSIAGIAGKAEDSKLSKLLGDKLVSVASALGQHKDPKRNLLFKPENTWIAQECSHLDLLSHPDVYTKIKSWLN